MKKMIIATLFLGLFSLGMTLPEAKQTYESNGCQTSILVVNSPYDHLQITYQCGITDELLDLHIEDWRGNVVQQDFLEIDVNLSTPNNGDKWDDTSGPSAEYQISNFVPGEYKFSVFGGGPDASSDSVHYGLNGVFLDSITFINVLPEGWSNDLQNGGNATITIPDSGIHVINLWAREDGAQVTKIGIAKQ